MMARERVVIIGNGPAANTAAETLREKDPAAKITLIGREPVRVYRPHLLPDLIAGSLEEERLYIHPFEFYKERDIGLRLGQEVVSVDFDSRKLVLAHKEVLRFDGLIIATGARPRIPERLQVFEDLMMTLKTVADAKAWIDTLSRVDSVLVIGGDLTSIGFTRTLLKLGKKVYFILERDAFWPMRFSDELRDEVGHCLSEQGVEVLDCRRINGMALLPDGQVEVETDCLHVHVGAVGAFFGMVPDIRFLARSRLYLERGILVDEVLQTRFEGV
jgi:NAD(P)H-nitrite reductase large subunit